MIVFDGAVGLSTSWHSGAIGRLTIRVGSRGCCKLGEPAGGSLDARNVHQSWVSPQDSVCRARPVKFKNNFFATPRDAWAHTAWAWLPLAAFGARGEANEARSPSMRWALWEASFDATNYARTAGNDALQKAGSFAGTGANTTGTNWAIELLYPSSGACASPVGPTADMHRDCASISPPAFVSQIFELPHKEHIRLEFKERRFASLSLHLVANLHGESRTWSADLGLGVDGSLHPPVRRSGTASCECDAAAVVRA
jgi:hypothetical protein